MTRVRLTAVSGLFALLLLVAPASQAQILPSFGVTGGLNFGTLSDATSVDLDEAVGYHVGLYTQAGIGPVGLRASLLYVRAGSLERPLLSDIGVSYIAVPIDIKYGAGLPLADPYVLFGPEARFPLGDLADADARSVAMALNVGAGVDVGAFIGPNFFAELRYAFDVTGFFDDQIGGLPAAQDETVRVNVFYLRLGIGL